MTTTRRSIPAAPEPWMVGAPCSQVDPELFFPTAGQWQSTRTAQALAVCKTCDVKVQCLSYALAGEEHGVWGGTTEAQRARLRGAS